MTRCKYKFGQKCRLNFEDPENMCWYENEATCFLKHKKKVK